MYRCMLHIYVLYIHIHINERTIFLYVHILFFRIGFIRFEVIMWKQHGHYKEDVLDFIVQRVSTLR